MKKRGNIRGVGRKPYQPKGGKPGTKPGMTAMKQVQRNFDIVAQADRGIRYSTLAAKYDLHEDRIGQIVREHRAARRKVLDEDVMVDHVNATLAHYEQAIEDLAILDIPAEHPAAYIGMMRLKLDTVKARWELLQAIGYVPQNLSTVRVQLEAIDVANELTAVLEAYDGHPVDDHLWDAAISALEGRPWRGPGGALPPGSSPPADAEGTAEDMPAAA